MKSEQKRAHAHEIFKYHLRWVGARPGNMHVPFSVLFGSAGAGGQDASCLFLLYPLNVNTRYIKSQWLDSGVRQTPA